jgi:uncharacterized protein (DUF4415 family)
MSNKLDRKHWQLLQKLAEQATGKEPRKIYSDLSRAKEFTDEKIAADVAADPDAAPLLDEWPDDAIIVTPQKKIPISLRIDPDTLDFFKQHGKGYLTLINAVLHAYAQRHRKIARK